MVITVMRAVVMVMRMVIMVDENGGHGDEDGGHVDENGGHGDKEGVHYDEDGGVGDQDNDFSFRCKHLQLCILFVVLMTPRVILGIDRCVCIDSMYVYLRFTDCTYRLKLRMNII